MFPLSLREHAEESKSWYDSELLVEKGQTRLQQHRRLHPKPASKETPANIWWKCDFLQIPSAEANSSPPPKPRPIALVERAVTYTYSSGQASTMIQILIHLANEESAIQLMCSDPPEKLKSTYLGPSLTDEQPIPQCGGRFSKVIASRAPPAGTAPLRSTNTKTSTRSRIALEKQNLERMRQQLQSKYKMHLKVIICITTSLFFCCCVGFFSVGFFFFSF